MTLLRQPHLATPPASPKIPKGPSNSPVEKAQVIRASATEIERVNAHTSQQGPTATRVEPLSDFLRNWIIYPKAARAETSFGAARGLFFHQLLEELSACVRPGYVNTNCVSEFTAQGRPLGEQVRLTSCGIDGVTLAVVVATQSHLGFVLLKATLFSRLVNRSIV